MPIRVERLGAAAVPPAAGAAVEPRPGDEVAALPASGEDAPPNNLERILPFEEDGDVPVVVGVMLDAISPAELPKAGVVPGEVAAIT